MTITIYTETHPLNYIKKDGPPSGSTPLTGSLVDGTTVVDPDILIESASLPSGNYAYIPEFGRYYHIKNIESVKNGLWRVKMHVDVLKTYESQILANEVIAGRSSSAYNLNLSDAQYKAYANPIVVKRAFPQGFNTFQFVLALLGGYDTN